MMRLLFQNKSCLTVSGWGRRWRDQRQGSCGGRAYTASQEARHTHLLSDLHIVLRTNCLFGDILLIPFHYHIFQKIEQIK